MRHLWSSVSGLVAAPVVWGLLGLGQSGSARTIGGWEQRGAFDTADLLVPAAYLLVAGVVLGLLATLRVSPAGSLVAGVLLAGPYLAMFADPFAVRDAVPADRNLFGEPLSLRLPLDNGTLLLVGVLLLMAGCSVQRWRRWPAPAAAPAAVATIGPAAGGPWESGAAAARDGDDTEPWRRPAAAETAVATETRPAAAAGSLADAPLPDGPFAGRPPSGVIRPADSAISEHAGSGAGGSGAGGSGAGGSGAGGSGAGGSGSGPAAAAAERPDAAESPADTPGAGDPTPEWPPAESPWVAPPRPANRENGT